MNKQEVLNFIKEKVRNGGEYPGETDYDLKEKNIKVKTLEDYGGENMGSTRYVVEEITTPNETFLVRIDGYYASYEGSDWSYASVNEVKAKEKTITVYEKV